MITLSSHVLDTTLGRPVADLTVRLERCETSGAFCVLCHAVTDENGRIADVAQPLGLGLYRLIFETGPYLRAQHGQAEAFYPEITVMFRLATPGEHYHIPLLLSPFGYSTYRGS
ncbi:MAG TPA: hydroxyisourate hydrolase [Polyangiales bacterium]